MGRFSIHCQIIVLLAALLGCQDRAVTDDRSDPKEQAKPVDPSADGGEADSGSDGSDGSLDDASTDAAQDDSGFDASWWRG